MDGIKLAPLFSGTSGLSVLQPKRDFPPEFQERSRLAYYASLFNTIEVNSSFYKVPMALTLKKWAESVPDNFQFTFKLWKEITHVKALQFEELDLARYMTVLSNIGLKKGCLLVQFPPSLSAESIHRLDELLSRIQAGNLEKQWKIAVEFRNRSWYNDAVYDLLHDHQAAMVFHDLPSSAAPLIDSFDFVYLRFHGPNGGYRGSYPDDLLYEYANYIKDWREEGKAVYVYFNNTVGDALKNLMTLNSYFGGAE